MAEKATITLAQRFTLLREWGKVCADRGWKTSDRHRRLTICGEIIGHSLASLDDVEKMDECTKLMKGLRAMLGEDLNAAVESEDMSINQARVLRHHILNELVPCLELYIADVRAYLAEVMADKNRWWKIDRPLRGIELTDLDAKPVYRRDKKTGEPREFPSQLKQLQMTLARCLQKKRETAGDSVHDMKLKARVPCGCALCKKSRVQSPESRVQSHGRGSSLGGF